jgi:hypothetical protein
LRNYHIAYGVSLLFFAASALFAAGLQPAPALLCLAGVVGSAVLLAQGLWRSPLLQGEVEGGWLLICLCLGAALAALGGEGHFFFAKDDWLVRDAVLADLALHDAPLRYDTSEGLALLRAPLGMYLAPAAVGRLLGLHAAHLALLAQTSLILGGFFYCVTLVWPRRRALFLSLFILFSGLDVIPVLMKTQGEWLPRYLAFWVDGMYYPANLSQLFWTPNHVLPGWWFAALAIFFLRREIDLAALAAASPPFVLWSPLTTAGASALFLFFAFRTPREALSMRFALSCAAAAGFAPILFYLAAAAGETPHRWLLLEKDFAEIYLIFLLFSLPQAFLLMAFWSRVAPWLRAALLASIALLLVIPFYNVGYMSDFAQRASIAPHALLAFGFDALLIDLIASGAAAVVGAGLVVVLGAATPLLELYDSTTTPRWSISDCNLATANIKYWGRVFVPTYLARAADFPTWLLQAGAETAPLRAETRACWPDRVFGERKFNYMKPEYRLWLRRPDGSDQR